jgi:two-component system, NtrC family, response regulator GlrR
VSEPIDTTTVGRERPRGPRARPAEAILRAVHPPGLELELALGEGAATLGRGAGTAVEHATVSRTHLAIEWRAAEDAHLAADAGSRNGSWLDGQRLGAAPRPLRDGAVLRAGDVLLVYERGAAAADAPSVSREALPGASLAARALRAAVARAAPDRAPVLLVGETGVGKERAAEELHRLSGRRGELVRTNCAALSAQLVEAQLFGHARGAFTGAAEAQAGFLRAAHEGTLLLDEVGELPLELQPKLLRALEERQVTPLGSSRPVPIDVRVVSATHRDLAAAVEAGAFRRDLYARLSLWEVPVSPLRARRADLLGWVATFHRLFLQGLGGAAAPLELTADAAELLLIHDWPTNLRGVERMVRHLAQRADGGAVAAEDVAAGLGRAPPSLPGPAAAPRPQVPTREEFTAEFERLAGSVHALARRYGRDRRQIYRWIAAFGLSES